MSRGDGAEYWTLLNHRTSPMPKRITPFVSLPAATLDHHHALSSLNENGAIEHAKALARVFIKIGEATTELQAVNLAHAEIARAERIARGVLVNRMARHDIDSAARARAVETPKATLPTMDLTPRQRT